MSHEKIRKMTITDKVISFTYAPNNVRPLDWHTEVEQTTEEHLRRLFRYLCGFCYQPQPQCRWWYNLMKEPFMNRTGYYLGAVSEFDIKCYNDFHRDEYGEYDADKIEANYQQFKCAVINKFKLKTL